MATKAAYKRLTKEYISFQKNPPPYLMAKPLESNILEWHYVIRGPPETPYHNGEYHGFLTFPPEYPFKPPAIRMITPSGRFQPDARLCLSMSDFHPSTWNPGWSVATILTGLLSFMCGTEATTGSIKTTDADKRIYAARSHQYNLNDARFREIFPELCLPDPVPVEILYPIQTSNKTTTVTSTNSPTLNGSNNKVVARLDFENPNPPTSAPTHPKRETIRVNKTNRGENATAPAGTAGTATNNNPVNVQNNNHNVGGQQRIFDQWRKWIIFLLLCLYLVVTKLLARSSEAVSGSANGGADGI
jgi:ubiquitin-conjugating enzyme E2 J2